MASLFKQTYTSTDKKTGQRVRRKSKKWYGQYTDERGRTRRVALCTDKSAAQAMLTERVRKAQRIRAGLSDPCESQLERPLKEHIDEFERHLRLKDSSDVHINQSIRQIRKVAEDCGFLRLSDFNADRFAEWLDALLASGRANRTFNSYLAAVRGFCRWLVKMRRLPSDPLAHISQRNSETDRRVVRRSLTADEFSRLLLAAANGPEVQGIPGTQRALLYLVACWTGLRRGELASLTRRSFDFSGEAPIVRVQAAHSKRRRNDAVPLHPGIAGLLQQWLDNEASPDAGQPVFSLRTASGKLRDTAKMMQVDLQAARDKWIEDGCDDAEQEERRQTEFLSYETTQGVADFHANRHTFISNLSRAGVSAKMAQSLARHCNVNLTLSVYTHVETSEQAQAVAKLPPPPTSILAETSEDGPVSNSVGPAGNLTLQLTQESDISCPEASAGVRPPPPEPPDTPPPKSLQRSTIGRSCPSLAESDEMRAQGLEPWTYGLKVRCSTN